MAEKNTDLSKMDDMLEDLFGAAKSDPAAQPSDQLMARVLTDADALQPAAVVFGPPVKQRGLLRGLFETLGGWQGTGGLVAATMASVWIGFSGADALTLEGLQAAVSGDTDFYLTDLGGDFSFDFGEG